MLIQKKDVVRHYFILGKAFGLTAREALCFSSLIGRGGIDSKRLLVRMEADTPTELHSYDGDGTSALIRYLTGYFKHTHFKTH